MLALFTHRVHCTNPKIGEAMTVLWATKLACSKKWTTLVIKSDCKDEVDCFIGEDYSIPWSIALIIREVKTSLDELQH